MRIQRHVLPVFMAAIIGLASPAWAQTRHIADPDALQLAVQAKVQTDAADRAVVTDALKSPEAATIAARLGLNLTRAQAAVATMEGTELAQLASTARAADVDRAAGANTVVISTTTLLLILLVIILIVR